MRRSYYLLLPVLWLMLVCTQQGLAQPYPNRTMSDPSVRPVMWYIPSPQTSAYMKYADSESALITGTAREEIPVYTYKDEDFTIPVSLGYATNGMFPSMQSGIVGLGWYLNAGGMITREIRNVPDDLPSRSWSRNPATANSGPKAETRESTGSSLELFEDWYYNGSENESDQFHFKFMGAEGSFDLDDTYLKLHETHLGLGTFDAELTYTSSSSTSEIVFSGLNGYKFVFGGDEQHLERAVDGTYKYKSDMSYDIGYGYQLSNPIVSWYLRKIIAPNGRQVSFEYTNGAKLPSSEQFIDSPNMNTNLVLAFSQGCDTLVSRVFYKRPSPVKTSYLSKISVANTADILFTYSPKSKREIAADAEYCYSKLVQNLQKLDKIEVVSKMASDAPANRLTCNLTYTTSGVRTLLDRVNIPGKGEYKMEYYLDHTLPGITTNAVDFWGYYNGHDEVKDTDPLPISIDETMDENVGGTTMNPNAEFAKTGCLRRITYPMGGQRTFEYEAHAARLGIFRRRAPSNLSDLKISFRLMLHPYSVMFAQPECGGVRIRKITDDDRKGGITTTEYSYTAEDGTCSGIMTSIPRFYYNRLDGRYLRCRGIQLSEHMFDRPHIEYEAVKVTRDDGSSVRYLFTSHRTNPDTHSNSGTSSRVVYSDCDTAFLKNIYRIPASMGFQRGRIRTAIGYDNSGRIVNRTRNIYSKFNWAYHDYKFVEEYMPLFFPLPDHPRSYMLYEKFETRYYPTDSLTTHTRYGYEQYYLQPYTVVRTESDGTVRGVYKNYHRKVPIDNVYSDYIFYPEPFETIHTVGWSGAERTRNIIKCEFSDYEYSQDNSGALLKSVNKVQYDESYVNGFWEMHDWLPYKPLTRITRYDTLRRPVEIYEEPGMSICRIWGYRGLYVVAEVRNVALSRLTAISGLEGIGSVPLEGGLTAAQETELRSIPNAEVVTCKYVPLIGKSEQTDAAGRKHSYEYDTYGRLVRERDHEGNVLKEYVYSLQ